MRTWVLILFRAGRDIVIGGYGSERDALDAGLAAWGNAEPMPRSKLEEMIVDLRKWIADPQCEKNDAVSHCNGLLANLLEAHKYVDDPVQLLHRLGCGSGYYGYGDYFQKTSQSPYTGFDVIPGAASA